MMGQGARVAHTAAVFHCALREELCPTYYYT